MNPYNYCAGNPVRLVDRDGREPWEDQNVRNAREYANKNGGTVKKWKTKDGYNSAFVQQVTVNKDNEVVVEAKMFKGEKWNNHNVFWNMAESMDQSAFGQLFAPGNSDGANQGSITSRDLSVGLGTIGLLTSISSLGTSTSVLETISVLVGAVNSADDMSTNRSGESFLQRSVDSKSAKGIVRGLKISAGLFSVGVDAKSVVTGSKSVDDIAGITVSAGDGMVSTVSTTKSIVDEIKNWDK